MDKEAVLSMYSQNKCRNSFLVFDWEIEMVVIRKRSFQTSLSRCIESTPNLILPYTFIFRYFGVFFSSYINLNVCKFLTQLVNQHLLVVD